MFLPHPVVSFPDGDKNQGDAGKNRSLNAFDFINRFKPNRIGHMHKCEWLSTNYRRFFVH